MSARFTRVRRLWAALRPLPIVFGLAAVGALPLLAPTAIAQVPAVATATDEGTFELVADGLPSNAITVLVLPSGQFLLPLRAVLASLGVPVTVQRDSGIVRISRPGGAGLATLRYSSLPPAINGVAHGRLDPADVVVRGDEVFIAAPRLAELLEATLDVDFANLMVHAARAQDFPARLHEDIAAKRAKALRRRAPADARPEIPFEPRTGLGVLEWAVGGGVTPPSLPEQVDARVGAGLLGGMLKTHAALSRAGGSTTGSTFDGSYQRVFPGSKVVRQVEIGDIFAGGSLARFMRGVTLTNAPFARSLDYGELRFSQPLPPGWEVELYEGDQLVGYREASSTGSLNSVPVHYGTTPLRVRLYGPAGEQVESQVTYVVPVEQLTEGAWQYALGGGRCAQHQCRELAYADLKRGVTPQLTLQAGADERRDSTERQIRPYVGASYLPAPGWVASLQARQDAYVRGAVSNQGEGRVTGSLAAGVNAKGEGGTAITAVATSSWFVQSGLSLRHAGWFLGERSLTLGARAQGQPGGDTRWAVSGSAPIPSGLMTAALETDPRAQNGGPRGSVLRLAPTIALTRGWWQRLGTPTAAFEVTTDGRSLVQWESNISLQPPAGFLSLGMRKLAGVPGLQASLGASIALRHAHLVTHLVGAPSRLTGGYSVAGAEAYGPLSHVMPLDFGGLGLAGVEGRVFHDNNGNGTFDEGDVGVPNAMVAVAGLRTVTDSSGRFGQWNVLPYEAVDVQLDSLSVEDPSWVPVTPDHWLRPSPHQFSRIDFPLIRTREVVGQLTTPRGMPNPAGVGLILRDSASRATYETRSFGDGGFYFSRVRAGHYLLTLTQTSLTALGAQTPPSVAIEVSARSEEALELPPIVLASRVRTDSGGHATPVVPLPAIAPPAVSLPRDGAREASRAPEAPQRTAHQRTTPRRTAPRRTTPQRTVPKQPTPKVSAPKRSAPRRVVSHTVAPTRGRAYRSRAIHTISAQGLLLRPMPVRLLSAGASCCLPRSHFPLSAR
ncbi:MAG: hypothetical protein M3Z05_15665 [Gemmatimonadota bacterium]|nr:hypothetical protein [Gemmatimonadota bacterium]